MDKEPNILTAAQVRAMMRDDSPAAAEDQRQAEDRVLINQQRLREARERGRQTGLLLFGGLANDAGLSPERQERRARWTLDLLNAAGFDFDALPPAA